MSKQVLPTAPSPTTTHLIVCMVSTLEFFSESDATPVVEEALRYKLKATSECGATGSVQ